jgi:hypothetical protein
MQLQDLKRSILELPADEVMKIHREVRENRTKYKPPAAKVSKAVNKVDSIVAKAEEADVDELDALIAKLSAMKGRSV